MKRDDDRIILTNSADIPICTVRYEGVRRVKPFSIITALGEFVHVRDLPDTRRSQGCRVYRYAAERGVRPVDAKLSDYRTPTDPKRREPIGIPPVVTWEGLAAQFTAAIHRSTKDTITTQELLELYHATDALFHGVPYTERDQR